MATLQTPATQAARRARIGVAQLDLRALGTRAAVAPADLVALTAAEVRRLRRAPGAWMWS
jgi:hypothetical protein